MQYFLDLRQKIKCDIRTSILVILTKVEEEGKVNVNKRKCYYLVSSFFFEWSEWNWWIFHELLSIWLVCDSKKKAEIIHISCEYLCLFEKEEASFSAHPSVQFNYLCLGCWSGYLVCMYECFFLTKQRRMIRCLLFTLSIW